MFDKTAHDPLEMFLRDSDDEPDVLIVEGAAPRELELAGASQLTSGGQSLKSQIPVAGALQPLHGSMQPQARTHRTIMGKNSSRIDWADDDDDDDDFAIGADVSTVSLPAGLPASATPQAAHAQRLPVSLQDFYPRLTPPTQSTRRMRRPPCEASDPNHVSNFVPYQDMVNAMGAARCPMTLYDWQADCLRTPDVLEGKANLVYCAPTSGGKSMVAELLMLRRVIEAGKPALLVLPYVSICTEKANHFKNIFSHHPSTYLYQQQLEMQRRGQVVYEPAPSPPTVVEFYGSLASAEELERVKGPAIIVATIEKANILINKWVEDANGSPKLLQDRLSAVTIDELHMVGDAQRGYLLELMLTKLRYLQTSIQIIGMSATISKVEVVASWLRARLYTTQYRPVPLQEFFVHGDRVTLPDRTLVKVLDTELVGSAATDLDAVTALVGESVSDGHSVIVFCSSRRACQMTAEFLARTVGIRRAMEVAARRTAPSPCGSHEKRRQSIADELQIHQNSPAIKGRSASYTIGARDASESPLRQQQEPQHQPHQLYMSSLAGSLEKTDLQISIENGISWHHAGLDAEERALVEQGFLSGAISVLCATSTLAAGVNLPARRVIIRQPYIAGNKENLLEPSKYKQMVGRAGRAGFDTAGESFLIGGNGIPDAKLYELMNQGIEPISSGLETTKNDLHRAILEVIASNCVSEPGQVREYVESTLLYELVKDNAEASQVVLDQAKAALDRLFEEGFIDWIADKKVWKPTKTGIAVHSSGLPPDVCRDIVGDLEKAQKAFVLDSDLHLIYLCVPLNEDTRVDWQRLASLLKRMDAISSSISEKVGVNMGLLNNMAQGTALKKQKLNATGGLNENTSSLRSQERIITRFWTALILQDVINETPWKDIEAKYGTSLDRGLVENMQDRASRFSGMLATFCAKSGWHKLELLIKEFQRRVLHGVKPEMMDLMEVPGVKPHIARLLFDAGLKTPEMLADSTAHHVEGILVRIYRDVSFDERPEMKAILTNHARGIVGRARRTVKEKRNRLIAEANRLGSQQWAGGGTQVQQFL